MFSIGMTVNFYDADPAGVLFFGNIFKLVHSVYERMIHNGELSRNYFNNENYIIPIMRTQAEFKKPIYPGAFIVIGATVSVLKKSSFELTYSITNEEGAEMAAAKTVHVFLDKTTGEQVPMPEEFTDYLRGI